MYIINKLQHLERKPHQPYLVFIRVLYPCRSGIWKWWFFRREENRSTRRKTPRSKATTNNKLNPHGIWTESNPSYIDGRRAPHAIHVNNLISLPVYLCIWHFKICNNINGNFTCQYGVHKSWLKLSSQFCIPQSIIIITCDKIRVLLNLG